MNDVLQWKRFNDDIILLAEEKKNLLAIVLKMARKVFIIFATIFLSIRVYYKNF